MSIWLANAKLEQVGVNIKNPNLEFTENTKYFTTRSYLTLTVYVIKP